MKRKVLKKWVERLLIIVFIIGGIMCATDSPDLSTFMIIHTIGLLLGIFSSTLLYKYTNIFEREF